MYYSKTALLFLLLILIGFQPLYGQDSPSEKERKQTFPISISLTNHSWSFPLTNIFRLDPIYPGMVIGTEFYFLKRTKSKLFQTVEIGGFINKNQGSALYLNSNFTYRYTTKFGLMSEVGLGLGYFHGFHRTATFEQQDSGEFIEVKDRGVGALSSNIAFGLGYDLSKKQEKNWMPFIRYQWIASTNYWSIIGIRPNGLLHLGVQINFI